MIWLSFTSGSNKCACLFESPVLCRYTMEKGYVDLEKWRDGQSITPGSSIYDVTFRLVFVVANVRIIFDILKLQNGTQDK